MNNQLYDTAADQSHADNVTRVEGSPQAASVTIARPMPRAIKEKRYKQAVIQRQSQRQVALTDFLVNLVKALRDQDSEARTEQQRMIGTFFQYYDGREYGEFNDAGEWQVDEQDDTDIAYSLPLTPAHTDSAKTLLLKTEIEYEYSARNRTSALDQDLAKMCEELAEEDMRRILTDDLRIDECLYLLLAGKSFRHHYWARNNLEPQTAEVPVYSTHEAEAEEHRLCGNADCGAPLGKTDAICPKCLSEDVITVSGGKTIKTEAETKTVTLAENQLYVPNPLQIQQDLSKKNIFQSFLIERDALPRSEAEFTYAQVLPDNKLGLSGGTQIMRELERSNVRKNQSTIDDGNAIIKGLFSDNGDLVERERVWLLPWQYANFCITEQNWHISDADGLFWCDDAEVPPDSKPVRPGTMLGDLFPSGMFLCVIDGTVVEISGEHVSDPWVKLTFGKRPANADGAGLQRLMPIADLANDATNLEMRVLMDDADPKTFVNGKHITHMSKVSEFTIVDVPEGNQLSDTAYRLPGAAPSPALGAMNERTQAFAQFLVGTFSATGAGAPDVKALNTATGVVQMAEQAAGRFTEAIKAMKSADIESRYKVLNNIRKHSIQPQKRDLMKRFGADVVKRFLSCNLRQAIDITPKRGTDMPQSQAIKIAQLQAYGEAVSKIGRNPQATSLVESFAEMIDLPITVGIGLSDKEEANRRISVLSEMMDAIPDEAATDERFVQEAAMKAVESVIQSSESEPPVMPEIGADGQPIPPEVSSTIMLQDHLAFMDAYKDWLQTEGARGTSPILKAAISMMWKLHWDREKEKQLELVRIETRKAMEAQRMQAQLQMEMQAAMQPPQPSPEEMAAMQAQQQQAEQEEIDRQIAMGVLERTADDEQKQQDFRREQEGKDADLERDLIRQQHAAEVKKDEDARKPKQSDK